MLLRNVDVRRMEVARVNVSPRHRDVRGDGVGVLRTATTHQYPR